MSTTETSRSENDDKFLTFQLGGAQYGVAILREPRARESAMIVWGTTQYARLKLLLQAHPISSVAILSLRAVEALDECIDLTHRGSLRI